MRIWIYRFYFNNNKILRFRLKTSMVIIIISDHVLYIMLNQSKLMLFDTLNRIQATKEILYLYPTLVKY